jgi:hypothetical protein
LRQFFGGFYAHPLPKLFLRSRRSALLAIGAVLLVLVAAVGIVLYQRSQPVVERINYSQIYNVAQTSNGVALVIEGEELTVRKVDGSLVQATVTGQAAQQEVIELFRKNNVPIEFRPVQPGMAVTLLNWFLPILMIGAIGIVGWRVYASMSGRGSFEVNDQNGKQDVGFGDVAGVDEARNELAETIEFLKDQVGLVDWADAFRAGFCFMARRELARLCWHALRLKKRAFRFLLLPDRVSRKSLRASVQLECAICLRKVENFLHVLSSSMKSMRSGDNADAAVIQPQPIRIKH